MLYLQPSLSCSVNHRRRDPSLWSRVCENLIVIFLFYHVVPPPCSLVCLVLCKSTLVQLLVTCVLLPFFVWFQIVSFNFLFCDFPASIFQLWVGTDSCLLFRGYICRIHVKLPTTLKLRFSLTPKASKQSEFGSNLVLLGCCRREVRQVSNLWIFV